MDTAAARFSFSKSDQSTVFLAVGLMFIIVMMVLPVPTIVLDFGLTASFALAILIFTVTLFIERPLDFSAFPTILLGSLILRLSLNISSTKLIIGDGHSGPDAAGSVIEGFAMFIMGGNFFLGLVVFCVLLIVNFMVITKGAGRMAEVGARFALDAMPGKQLAIDSDVASGAISHAEATERRRIEQEETTFFGSLDGASKFVKGDAVAGLLITLLNLIAGLALGVGMHGLPVGEAISTYAILTVGDGLVSQIPAVIISIATALLLSKGGGIGSADKAVFSQLGGHPIALGTVSGILGAFALLPGLPFAPFLLGAAFFGGAAYLAYTAREKEKEEKNTETLEPAITEKPLGDLLDIDEIHLEFAGDLVAVAMDKVLGLDTRIIKIRRFLAEEYGFVTPPVRLTDNLDLKPGEYRINVQGVVSARGAVEADRLLVITDDPSTLPVDGRNVNEPVYNAPARWIAREDRDRVLALDLPVVEPAEVIATHLLETIKSSFATLLTRKGMRRILDEFARVSDPDKAKANRRLIDEFINDKMPLEFVQNVFKLLLEEKIPVRNLPLILEAIDDAKAEHTAPEQICEKVRQRIAASFSKRYLAEDGALPLIQISMDWEDLFQENEIKKPTGAIDIALPPDEFNRLSQAIREQIDEAQANGVAPVILTTAHRRRFIRTVLHAKRIDVPVMSYEEIDPQQKLRLIGKV